MNESQMSMDPCDIILQSVNTRTSTTKPNRETTLEVTWRIETHESDDCSPFLLAPKPSGITLEYFGEMIDDGTYRYVSAK
jgi:hypothetical protein